MEDNEKTPTTERKLGWPDTQSKMVDGYLNFGDGWAYFRNWLRQAKYNQSLADWPKRPRGFTMPNDWDYRSTEPSHDCRLPFIMPQWFTNADYRCPDCGQRYYLTNAVRRQWVAKP